MSPRLSSPIVALLALAVLATSGCRMEAPRRPEPVVAAPPRFSADVDPEAARAVRALASSDFAERSRAADVLVAMGDPALSALGQAGELQVTAHGRASVSATGPVVAAILASVGEERLVGVHLVAAAPNVRRAAAREIGRRGSIDAAPALIARLEDPDAAVRTSALASLRVLAASHDAASDEPAALGSRPEREEAALWRAWWSRRGSSATAALSRSR